MNKLYFSINGKCVDIIIPNGLKKYLKEQKYKSKDNRCILEFDITETELIGIIKQIEKFYKKLEQLKSDEKRYVKIHTWMTTNLNRNVDIVKILEISDTLNMKEISQASIAYFIEKFATQKHFRHGLYTRIHGIEHKDLQGLKTRNGMLTSTKLRKRSFDINRLNKLLNKHEQIKNKLKVGTEYTKDLQLLNTKTTNQMKFDNLLYKTLMTKHKKIMKEIKKQHDVTSTTPEAKDKFDLLFQKHDKHINEIKVGKKYTKDLQLSNTKTSNQMKFDKFLYKTLMTKHKKIMKEIKKQHDVTSITSEVNTSLPDIELCNNVIDKHNNLMLLYNKTTKNKEIPITELSNDEYSINESENESDFEIDLNRNKIKELRCKEGEKNDDYCDDSESDIEWENNNLESDIELENNNLESDIEWEQNDNTTTKYEQVIDIKEKEPSFTTNQLVSSRASVNDLIDNNVSAIIEKIH
jgi:hypothetical protein